MEAVSGLGNDDDSSVLISTEGRQRRGGGRRRKARRSKGGEGGATTQLTVHSHGLKSKQPTNTLQVAAGQGYTVDVVDEAAYPKYLFVNADEYGLFARKRKFLQLVVCYQVLLSTQWNSHAHREAELGEASQLKPRYLFLYHDAVFVMKCHDGVDTNTRRYRVLARLALHDTSVAAAGDDMFDLVCRNAGALRFKVGSALTRGQTVALFAAAIEQRLARARPVTRDTVAPPQNPDDVYETMNYALAVLEKKMRGQATPEERYQVDQLLNHAIAMQNELHGPAEKTLLSGGGAGGGGAVQPSGNRTAAEHMAEQLRAKEAQLRALEDRVASAEAALARLRGTSAIDDAGHRSLAADNRMLRVDVDRLTAQLEERDKHLFALREEVAALRSGRAVDTTYRRYGEGTVDQVLDTIRRQDAVPVAATTSYESSSARALSPRPTPSYGAPSSQSSSTSYVRDASPPRPVRDASPPLPVRAISPRVAPSPVVAAVAHEEEEELVGRVSQYEEAEVVTPPPAVVSPPPPVARAPAAAAAAEESNSEEVEYEYEEEEVSESDSQQTAAPAAVAPPVVAAPVRAVAASAPAQAAASESGSLESEELSEELSSMEASPLETFLQQHDLSRLLEPLEDADVDLDALRQMDVAGVRALDLPYADASLLAVALGLPNVYA